LALFSSGINPGPDLSHNREKSNHLYDFGVYQALRPSRRNGALSSPLV
jgi:hypothetical protein